MVDRLTKSWIRNKSDEAAAANGCYFDLASGAYTVWWIERFCRLYEGEHAREPVLLRSGNPELDHVIHDDWDAGGVEKSLERAKAYDRWFHGKSNKQVDWQYECFMRLFGWMRKSKRWGRPIRRFNQASIWVPKKQKKTPSLASVGVYLICGDGEDGAKCFGGAKDGRQAQIAMKHAIAMIEQSPELAAECKINKNEMSITHVPTRSSYFPMSSGNERHQRSKEGINGNVLIDETHVVDRHFIKIISRAGISRSEPLHIEVSTAGNNPDGYGKERQDYARQVLSGAEHNDQLFVAIYEAPQDLSDEDLAKDPCKYGRMANPAWGHTCHEEEFLADYNESKRTISGLADFKMYRLNIWQHTSRQWLRLDDWLSCGTADLQFSSGERCAVGLDLSKTRDCSAMVVAVPDGDVVRITPRIWMTESYMRQNADKAAFVEWEASGELNIIPGDIIQHSFLKEEFSRLAEAFSLQVLVYDKTYAGDFIEWIEDEHKRVLCVEYPQSSAFMEGPIDDFEAAVIEGKLRHENNRCLNWQAGHTSVAENAKGHRILSKPKKDDYRKIDAMVSAVMAYWGSGQLPKTQSVYRRRGVLMV